MGDRTCLDDRFSELPDFILHHILSFLSPKEAAQTGLISKRWQSVWETFPILDCIEVLFGRKLDLLNPKELGMPKDERRNIYNQREKFMSYVDKRLQRFQENSLCVQKFLLRMTLVSHDLAARVDTWMELVSSLRVKELDLYLTVGRGRLYVLPTTVLAVESLTVLSLRGCLLSSTLNTSGIKLSSLIQLHLRDVCIDEETIQSFISSIHLMEVLSLKNCFGFKNLEISDHDKLKNVVYQPHKDIKVEKFSVNLSALEELDFCSVDKDKTSCEIVVSSACQKLKRLSLFGLLVNTKWLQDMISCFPQLEHLFLGGCVLQEVMRLSSTVLKKAFIWNCKNLVRVEFDTPNLQLFNYRGFKMPCLDLNSVSDNRVAEIYVRLRNMDNSWFTKLNNFISENKFQDLTISVADTSVNDIPFNAEDLEQIQFPPFELNSMRLVTHAVTLGNYALLLDGLLGSLRPQILSLELNYYSSEFLKGLLKSLVAEEEPRCCCSENFKCWRHSLKDIKLSNVKGFKSGFVLNTKSLGNLITFLDNWAIDAQRTVKSYKPLVGETLSFDLSW